MWGWTADDDDVGGQLLPVDERHARHAARAGQHPLDRCVRAHDDAVRLTGAADGIGHCAHAASWVAPLTERRAGTDVADGVVQHHVGRARLLRSGPRTDHAVDGHHRLHRLGLEPLAQEVAHAHREEPRHIGGLGHVEPPQPPGHLELVEQVRRSLRAQLGRHLGE